MAGALLPLRAIGLLFLVATIQLMSAGVLSAQEYGLQARPSAQAYLNMPTDLPTPSGDYIAELAFPNLAFPNPVFLTYMPGTNQLVVCEREGRIYTFQNDPGTSTKTTLLDVSAVTQGWDDCGLLGMAFHPEFGVPGSPNRGYFYVLYHYSDNPTSGPNRPPSATPAFNRLARFTIPDGSFVADPASELVMIQQHDRHVWHNGGTMFFHPSDGFLYFCIGDEGAANDSYNSTQKIDDKLFGGVFRIDVDMQGGAISHPIRRQPQSYVGRPAYTQNYYIPSDNPWQDPGGTILEEFWALGVRSPHRMTYDATADLILLGDVGQGTWEEVSVIEKGGNYQWPYKEGFANGSKPMPTNLIGVEKPPIYDYRHGSTFPFQGNCVIGGYIYRGTEHPDLVGKYIFGDNTRGRIWAMDLSVSPVQVTYLCNMPSGSNYNGLSSFGLDANNELYMCKMGHTGDGFIYKLGRASTTGAPVPPLLSQTGAFSDTANLVPASSLIPYDVGSPLFSDHALKSRWLSVPDGQKILFNQQGEWVFPAGTVFVKHFELVDDEVTQAVRRLETRLVVQKPDGGVYGVTYKWRADNSEADLLMNGLDEDITITTATGSRVQTWAYPSSQACLTCHNPAANFVLGVKTRQQNNNLHYPGTGVTDNQLRSMNHIGLFDVMLNEGDIPTYDSLSALSDTGPTLEHKLRSYIDANCGHCHRPGHVQAFFDARFDTPLALQGLIDGVVGNDLGISGAKVLFPQDVNRSVLWLRDNSLDSAIKMPPLAKNTIHDEWITLLEQYINGLPGLPVLDAPAITPAGGGYDDMVDVSISHPEPTAQVYYTTDGSVPDTNAILYGGTFTLTASASVKAKAYAPGFVDSVVVEEVYTVSSFRNPENPPVVSPGVDYEQYLGSFDFLPNFDSLTPDENGTRSNFNISPRLQNDFFAFRFTGFIDIPSTDIYTFYTNSDDGSQLFIGSTLVVDNDGLHGPATQSGQIALKAGLHAITVTFFEKGGGEVLDVDYESPSMARTPVPDSALFFAENVATVSISDLTVVYDGSMVAMSATTNPPGLSLMITYNGIPMPPSDAGVYSVVATVTDPVYQGQGTANLTIEQALASVAISDTNQVYDGTGRAVTVTTNPLSLLVSTTYNGSATLPVDVGSYSVDADVIDPNYTGSSSATLVIDPGSAGITLGNLTQTYDGTARVVSATTSPAGLALALTYDGSSIAPTDVGSYAVSATISDPNYSGSDSAILIIDPASASITLSDLTQVYDGTPRLATATTSPGGLPVDLTYNGSSSAPTDVGSYAVNADISDPNYTGTANGSLQVQPATASVSLGNLTQPFTGSPDPVTVTTVPASLAVDVTYNGSATVPSAVGSYAVTATINDPNYTGSASGTLVIQSGLGSITITDLSHVYDGSSQAATVTTNPPGLSVNVTYNGSASLPVNVGSYSVDVTITDPSYSGSSSATLVISPATATVALAGLSQIYDGTPRIVSATTTPAGLPVNLTYAGSGSAPTAVGSYAINAAVNDPNYTGSASGTLQVSPATASIGIAGLSQTFDGSGKSATVTTTPPSLAFSTTYNGSASLPINAGSYAVDVNITDPNYGGSNSAIMVIDPAAASIALGNLSQVYDGTARAVSVTTTPASLAFAVTYAGSSTAPVAAGSYAVNASIADPNYIGSAADTLVVQAASASLSLSNLTQAFTGSPLPVTVTTLPAGLATNVTYNGSGSVPSAVGSYAVSATIADPNYTGSAAGTLIIQASTVSISITGLSHIYDGSGKSAIVTTTPPSLAYTATYNGSATLPVDVGSYMVDVTITEPNFSGSNSATLVISPAAASVSITGLTHVYDGGPKSATVTTNPPSLPITVTYNGGAQLPIGAGTYTVDASVNDPNYTGSNSASLSINPAAASVSFSDLTQVYDGTAKSATITTTPSGLALTTTHNGVAQLPVDAGTYTVDTVIANSNFVGGGNATLTINPATAILSLSNLAQVYDGTQRVVSVATVPNGLAVDLTYDGSATPPVDAGSYAVVANASDPNYLGSTSGSLTVAQAAAMITLENLSQTFTGGPRVVTATTVPAGLAVDILYDGSSTPPVAVGSYAIEGSINDPNFTGSANGTLTVAGVPSSLALETGIVSDLSSDAWTTVNLPHTFASMVVVCTPVQTAVAPFAVRVRNALGNSFEVSLARVDGIATPLTGISVHYVAVEEGIYTQALDGVTMEAVKYLSTVTDENNSWSGESQSYANSYTNPVVIGQVMTANDSAFSVFWARGSAQGNPPSSSELYVGKHVAEDPIATRSDETVGYIVLEQGSGTIDNTPYYAALGADTILGTGNAAPYSYAFASLGTSTQSAVLSTAGVDGGNGGWPVLYGADPLQDLSVDLAVEEDMLGDSERSHISEQIAYVIFGHPFTTPPTIDQLTATPAMVLEGGQTMLEWKTSAATSVSIDNGIGVVPADGSVMVLPAATTIYKLTADGPMGSVTAEVTVTVLPRADVPFDRGSESGLSNTGWSTINLSRPFNSPVVVCTPVYDRSSPSMVVRVRNAAGSSFEAMLARTDGSTAPISGIVVHYMVVEAGVYTMEAHGVKMEAASFTPSITDRAGSWNGVSRSYGNSYSNPVVLGQVMTANDSSWSAFWCSGSGKNSPPSSSALKVGKHVAEDPSNSRVPELVGYIVIEQGGGLMNSTPFVAALGSDSIKGFDDSPPYSYSPTGLTTASIAIVTQAAMDGNNGGWAVLYGPGSVSASELQIAIDEDQLKDSERKHTGEQAGYIVFDDSLSESRSPGLLDPLLEESGTAAEKN